MQTEPDQRPSLHRRVVVEPLLHDLAVSPLCDGDLLQMNRLSVRRDEIHRRFVKRVVVADTGRRDVEPFSFFYTITPFKNCFSRSMLAANPFVGGLALSCITVSLS